MSQVSGASSFRSTAQFDLQKITECRAPIVARTSPDQANPNMQPYYVQLLSRERARFTNLSIASY